MELREAEASTSSVSASADSFPLRGSLERWNTFSRPQDYNRIDRLCLPVGRGVFGSAENIPYKIKRPLVD